MDPLDTLVALNHPGIRIVYSSHTIPYDRWYTSIRPLEWLVEFQTSSFFPAPASFFFTSWRSDSHHPLLRLKVRSGSFASNSILLWESFSLTRYRRGQPTYTTLRRRSMFSKSNLHQIGIYGAHTNAFTFPCFSTPDSVDSTVLHSVPVFEAQIFWMKSRKFDWGAFMSSHFRKTRITNTFNEGEEALWRVGRTVDEEDGKARLGMHVLENMIDLDTNCKRGDWLTLLTVRKSHSSSRNKRL